MSIPVRHSGRIAFAALIVITLIAALLGVRLFAVAVAPPPRFETDTTTQPTFTIGPIEGLTTTWHWAPPVTSIPLGTIAAFFQPAPPDATVNWTGAAEVARDDGGSTAVCPLVQLGIIMVQVEVIPADIGGKAISSQSRFNVVDIDVEQITVSAMNVWVDPIEIDEDLPEDEINEQTVQYFFDSESIAALRDLGHGQYRTSVNRWVRMSVEVDPPGFAPLIEWRFDGQPVHAPPVTDGGSFMNDPAPGMGTDMGMSVERRFPDTGNYVVEVGPLLNPEQIELETYSVTITSHTSGQDIIEEGEPVLFVAETDPPGYEDDITWLSSTKYGTAEPILGEGPIFFAEFNDTWGYDPEIGPWQWLGVKADNATFGQDGKGECPACPPPEDPPVFVCPLDTNGVANPDGCAVFPIPHPDERCKTGVPGEVVSFTLLLAYDNCELMCRPPGGAVPVSGVIFSLCQDWSASLVLPGALGCGPCPQGAGSQCVGIGTASVVIPQDASPGDEEAHCITIQCIGQAPCNNSQTVVWTRVVEGS